MTVLGMINVNIVTSILNTMHKVKAMKLVEDEVLCIMLELCHALFPSLYRHLNCISMIGAGLIIAGTAFSPVMDEFCTGIFQWKQL